MQWVNELNKPLVSSYKKMPTVIGNLNFHVYQAESVLFTKLGWISPEMKEKLLQYDMAIKIEIRWQIVKWWWKRITCCITVTIFIGQFWTLRAIFTQTFYIFQPESLNRGTCHGLFEFWLTSGIRFKRCKMNPAAGLMLIRTNKILVIYLSPQLFCKKTEWA